MIFYLSAAKRFLASSKSAQERQACAVDGRLDWALQAIEELQPDR